MDCCKNCTLTVVNVLENGNESTWISSKYSGKNNSYIVCLLCLIRKSIELIYVGKNDIFFALLLSQINAQLSQWRKTLCIYICKRGVSHRSVSFFAINQGMLNLYVWSCVKRSFACQGGCYPWHGAPFNVPIRTLNGAPCSGYIFGWDVKWCPVSRIRTLLARERPFHWISMKSRLLRAAWELNFLKTIHI